MALGLFYPASFVIVFGIIGFLQIADHNSAVHGSMHKFTIEEIDSHMRYFI